MHLRKPGWHDFALILEEEDSLYERSWVLTKSQPQYSDLETLLPNNSLLSSLESTNPKRRTFGTNASKYTTTQPFHEF